MTRLLRCTACCCGLLLVLAFCGDLHAAGAVRAGSPRSSFELLQNRHHERYEKFAAALETLASECEQAGLAGAAAEVRSQAVPPEQLMRRVSSLPKAVRGDIPHTLPAEERVWRVKLRGLETSYAQDLYMLSRQVLYANGGKGYPSYAYHLVREVAMHDPDHKAARGLLGYVRNGDEWITPFADLMQRKRNVWHERFGWIPKTHVERYEQGERYVNRRWISAAQESEIRRDFRNAWEVRTDHFLVKTNHSLERGVELAQGLEDFYRFFMQTFAGFFNTREQMQKLFEGNSTASVQRAPHEVHYYRTREEYIERLKGKIPQIEITNGLYMTDDRTSYFYHDPQAANDATVFHEATHQIFYESHAAHRRIADQENFWIVEGISCYMESFRNDPEESSLGDPRYIRFEAARYRYANDGYYIPLAEFCGMGMQAFQTHAAISKNYSQASGLSHFFMHYDGGRYRDALVDHLAQIYSSSNGTRLQVAPLSELTGVPFDELDRQYGEYIRTLGDDSATTP